MKIKAIFNRDGGTFRTTDMDAYSQKAEEVFRSAGHEIEITVASGDGMAEILEKTARRDDLDAMLAGGGDGTISAAAAVAWKNGMPLGVVPAGTMNLFARALKLPLDIWKVLDVLADGKIVDADISAVPMAGPSCISFPWGCTPAWCATANPTALPRDWEKSAPAPALQSA